MLASPKVLPVGLSIGACSAMFARLTLGLGLDSMPSAPVPDLRVGSARSRPRTGALPPNPRRLGRLRLLAGERLRTG
jgi:hypothetical protein